MLTTAIIFALLFVGVGGYVIYNASHAGTTSELQSGVGSNYNGVGGPDCLEDRNDGGINAQVGIASCNGSPAQYYYYDTSLSEIHIGAGCAIEEGASASKGVATSANVVIGPCSNPAPWGGAWTRSGNQFHNNHAGSGYCLDVTGGGLNDNVGIYPCKAATNNLNQLWYQGYYSSGSSGTPAPSASGVGGGGSGPNLTNLSACPLGYPCITYGDSVSGDRNFPPGTTLLSAAADNTTIEFQSDWNFVARLNGNVIWASGDTLISNPLNSASDSVHLALQRNGDIVSWNKRPYSTTYEAQWALHTNFGTSIRCLGQGFTLDGFALVLSPLKGMEVWTHSTAYGGRWHIIFSPSYGVGCSQWNSSQG